MKRNHLSAEIQRLGSSEFLGVTQSLCYIFSHTTQLSNFPSLTSDGELFAPHATSIMCFQSLRFLLHLRAGVLVSFHSLRVTSP